MKNPYKDKIGKERVYSDHYKNEGRDDVVLWDIFPLGSHTRFKLEFLSQNRNRGRQGVTLRSDTQLTVNDVSSPSMNLWFPESKLVFFKKSPMVIDCLVESQNRLLSVYNIYEDSFGKKASLTSRAGMLVTEVSEVERVYACQDPRPNPDFNSLKFKITLG